MAFPTFLNKSKVQALYMCTLCVLYDTAVTDR